MPGNDTQTASAHDTDGAFGDDASVQNRITNEVGHGEEGDRENAIQPNSAIKVIPAPDLAGEEPEVNASGQEWTGSKTGGQAPPGTSKTH